MPPIESAKRQHPCTVLMVDDDRELLSACARFLRGYGYNVIECDSPFGVSHAVRRHQPEIVVLDINMPALNGVSLGQLMERDEYRVRPRIVYFSALEEETMREMALSSGSALCVSKRDGVTTLLKTLRDIRPV